MDGHFSFVCVRFFTARSQGFRCAPPPACGLPPLAGLGNVIAHRVRGFHRLHVYRGSAALHRLPVVCRPCGAKWMNKHQSSYFISFKALTSGFFLSLHHQNNKIDFPSKI
jgi:hypothetical protein